MFTPWGKIDVLDSLAIPPTLLAHDKNLVNLKGSFGLPFDQTSVGALQSA
jgi:hypothetical protein